MLKISELAAKTGLSAHTIRFYEKHGLVCASERSESGYRHYNDADIRRAEFVKTARNIGFSLEDIAQLLSIRLDKSSHSCQEVTEITQHKLDEVNGKIEELQSMQRTLEILLENCSGGPESAIYCSIMGALELGQVVKVRSIA
ncbi:MAG: Zn(2+)-responsive transcriptional regulator [Gammaproteobacteria bacterium]|nr:Zn(2+)-responsive transcriptional regulator [Gammaproteobacteria bacterium]|tara:strand:- start:152 stop:580 length:429 start_codon:yes stop_codon:yes gene_type:complete